MRLNRFITAREVFEAFPTAADDIVATPADKPPLVFLKDLVESPTPEDAISFCAYLLPRREAVWWACGCVRGMAGGDKSLTEQQPGFRLAEAWVRDPAEPRRVEALRYGMSASRDQATTWLAIAAGWSGGSMNDDPAVPVPAPPHLTAKAVRAAILVALATSVIGDRRPRLRTCVDHGLKLLERDKA